MTTSTSTSTSLWKCFKPKFKFRQKKHHQESLNAASTERLIPNHGNTEIDKVFLALREKSIQLTQTEPYMRLFLEQSILHPQSTNFNAAVSRAVATRLVSSCGNNPIMCVNQITEIIENAMNSTDLEYGHRMSDAVCQDILACVKRDPACETELEVVLFYKGFAALVCHRAARRHYTIGPRTIDGSSHLNEQRRFVSLWLQSQASAAFGVDIHPAAEIGSGVFFDHATGLVIGETAKVGDNCTILHGVTLGGTGKDAGDRHPKVGNDVLIGAGTKVLGNIKIGDGAKIGAGSIVLKPIPHGATAVGAPAKIIGWAKENKPGSSVDNALKDIVMSGAIGTTDDNSGASTMTQSISTLSFGNDYDSSSRSVENEKVEEKNHEKSAVLQINKISSRRISSYSDNMCVFRMFSGGCTKPETLAYKDLNSALRKTCTEDEIGEVYMELLKNDPGKQSVLKKEASKNISSILQRYTKINEEQFQDIRNKLAL